MKQGRYYSWFGKLANHGKAFYLFIIAESVHLVLNNSIIIIVFPRKSMIRCGLLLDVNGVWLSIQLFPHFQEILNKHLL